MSPANPPPWRVLFVCSGNLCRSPMAEGLARDYAAQSGVPMEVRSAGTLGLLGRPAEANAIAVCQEVGIDIAGHVSQGVSDELIDWADWILVMEYAHAADLRGRFPRIGENLRLLGSFGGVIEIADPLGGWKFQFRRSREEILKCVKGFVDWLPERPEAP